MSINCLTSMIGHVFWSDWQCFGQDPIRSCKLSCCGRGRWLCDWCKWDWAWVMCLQFAKGTCIKILGTDVHAQHTYIYRYHCASHHVISYSHHIISYLKNTYFDIRLHLHMAICPQEGILMVSTNSSTVYNVLSLEQAYKQPSKLLGTNISPSQRHIWRWFSFSQGGICWFPRGRAPMNHFLGQLGWSPPDVSYNSVMRPGEVSLYDHWIRGTDFGFGRKDDVWLWYFERFWSFKSELCSGRFLKTNSSVGHLRQISYLSATADALVVGIGGA